MNSSRTNAVIWLRKTHGWIGLWGATLGLLFGFSGIWLNHRAVLPLQLAQQRDNAQVRLPDPPPADAQAMAAWLQAAMALPHPASNVKVEPPKPAPWAERGAKGASAPQVAMQPEHWTMTFAGPKTLVQADYWVGNHAASVRRTDSGFVATLTNLHKGIGMPVAWILLVDTLAGSMIVLSLSGLALWMLTRRKRVVGLVIFGSCLAVTAGLAIAHL